MNLNLIARYLSVLTVFFLMSCTGSQSTDITESKSDRGKRLVADNAMVSSAHPLASEAGLSMLKKGGNAVDAAVATAFALNVVEPNMSGIGGGGSMLIWDQEDKHASYVDFYTAKRSETYKDLDFSKYPRVEFNLLVAGIPGTVAGLLQVLEKHGTLSRSEVMEPAIRYATDGFPIYLTLAQFIQSSEEKLGRYEGARNTFWPNGKPLQVGEILKQPELAKTLQNISDNGASAFYEGKNAEDMVKLYNEGGNPVSLKDFADFEPQWNKLPLCGSYRGYTVLSAPMPQTGFFILQALNILEDYNLKQMGLPLVSSEAFNVLTSTLRLSLADRAEYVEDPNWVDIPIDGLISKDYAAERRKLISAGSLLDSVKHGTPESFSLNGIPAGCENVSFDAALESAYSASMPFNFSSNSTGSLVAHSQYDSKEDAGETTHISVIDADGNAVSFSTTLSSVFGSGAWVNGFMINDSGFFFRYLEEPEEWDSTHPYRVRASTILPTIILDGDEVRLVIGAPGGGRIPTAVLQNIVYILDYDLDPLDAVRMPRVFPEYRNTKVQIEHGFEHNTLAEVRNMGYDIQSLSQGYARIYLVYNKDGKLIGVSDPRHDGEPRGY